MVWFCGIINVVIKFILDVFGMVVIVIFVILGYWDRICLIFLGVI